mgnify:FL=1
MDINTITVAELRTKAKELGNIPGYSKMKKAELFDAVVSAIGDNSSVETVSSPEGVEVITLSEEIDRSLVAAGLPTVSEYKERMVGDAITLTDEEWAEMIREEDRMKKMNRAQRRAYAKRKRIFETKKRMGKFSK